jgi:signal transduction histidine kinase
MRLGIKGKQVLGVTTVVALTVAALSLMHLGELARVKLFESHSRAELLANAVYHRARQVVESGTDPGPALAADSGLRAILESSLYSPNVTFAALVDASGNAVAHADPAAEGQPLRPAPTLDSLLASSSLIQLREIYAEQGRNFEYRQPLYLLGGAEFGSIRIGVSTLLIRRELNAWLKPASATALIALAASVFAAMLLAQVLLRPIHVIRGGLTRLGRGEFGVRLDLNQQDEFGELGTSFNAVSAQLSADRSQMAGQVANLESAVERLEDAVAIVSQHGELLFANPALRAILPDAVAGTALDSLVPPGHPIGRLAAETLRSRESRGPASARLPGEHAERLIVTHPVNDARGDLVGIMLIVRNIEYLSQVESTLRYSRKLVALGRLSAGVAHEVKNPLNAMMIHLELLRQQFVPHTPIGAQAVRGVGRGLSVVASVPAPAPAPETAEALQHVDVIAAEIRRLDEVVQGFLKFTRPEDLTLQVVRLSALFDDVAPIIRAEAARTGVQLVVECEGAPDVNGDPGMLRQAFLNLGLNACQAMPNGGTLRIQAEATRRRQVAITFADTGVGIKPEHLQRIFDLYFTTKDKGSGIGLSMVYRTIQMHDGEVEVQSTLGKGTTFRLLIPQA